MAEICGSGRGRFWRPLYDSTGGNPPAAMPFLHFATSVTAARVLSEVGRAPGALERARAVTPRFDAVDVLRLLELEAAR